jgi:hypothetical protein
MLIDQYELFSSAQAITAEAASTNLIDLKAARNMGTGARPLYIVAQVTTAFTDGSSNSELDVKVEADDDVAFGSIDTTTTIGQFAALSAVGTQVIAMLPPAAANYRYVRLKYTPIDGDLSAGAVTAFITADPQLWAAYAKGYTGPTTA